jgi:hypothetical protein
MYIDWMQVLTSFAGGFGAVAAGVAAFFRFRAWWLDRSKQTRIDSATYLKEKGATAWEREFGEQELVRVHFASLTGIDKRGGHEAIRRLHRRLGGTDFDWGTIKGIGTFLDATRPVAVVKKATLKQHLFGGMTALASAVFAFGSALCGAYLAASLEKWGATEVATKGFTLASLFLYFNLVILSVVLAASSFYSGVFANEYINSLILRRKLLKMAFGRRKARQAGARRGSKADVPARSELDQSAHKEAFPA